MGYALLNPLSLGYQNFQDYLTLGGKRQIGWVKWDYKNLSEGDSVSS